jgi:hypothetical protein
MYSRTMKRCALVVMGLMTLSGGCQCPWSGPQRVKAPKINPNAAADAVAMFDKNGDGKLSGKELEKCPGLKAALARLDPAKTGHVTADMIDARIGAWVESKLGRLPLRCSVTHNGQPLQGAEVKFVPEPFLGTKIQTATGVTDANGVAMLSAPANEQNYPPGVSPGFYRVEITKSGAAIPARYSTDTILGAEIAIDVEEIRIGGFNFDLKF